MYQNSFYVYGKKVDILKLHEKFGNIRIHNMEFDIVDCSQIFVDINMKKITWTHILLIIREW